MYTSKYSTNKMNKQMILRCARILDRCKTLRAPVLQQQKSPRGTPRYRYSKANLVRTRFEDSLSSRVTRGTFYRPTAETENASHKQ